MTYVNPPSEFMDVMDKTNPDFNYTDWELSPEWRFFIAGRKYELNQTNRLLKRALKYIK